MSGMTRGEHLAWCKTRARQEFAFYLKDGTDAACRNAIASMISDLGKHPETQGSVEIAFMLGSTVRDAATFRRYVDGFN